MKKMVDTGQTSAPAGLLQSSLKFGAATGSCGVVIGATWGVLRSIHPVLFAAVTGAEWFGLGSVFWGSREYMLKDALIRQRLYTMKEDSSSAIPQLNPPDQQLISAAAGGVSGGLVSGLIRGIRAAPANVALYALVGFSGQYAYNWLDKRRNAQATNTDASNNSLQRMAKSRWSPVKALSNEEYADLLREKLLRVETEIALIDDKMEELKGQGEKPLGANNT